MSSKEKFKKFKKKRQEAYNISSKILYYLRHHKHKIHIKKIARGVYGYFEDYNHEITLDYRRDLVPTLIHEILHDWHMDWSETKVIKEERRIVNLLTPRQATNILKALVKII